MFIGRRRNDSSLADCRWRWRATSATFTVEQTEGSGSGSGDDSIERLARCTGLLLGGFYICSSFTGRHPVSPPLRALH
jgi:hypothetical protein